MLRPKASASILLLQLSGTLFLPRPSLHCIDAAHSMGSSSPAHASHRRVDQGCPYVRLLRVRMSCLPSRIPPPSEPRKEFTRPIWRSERLRDGRHQSASAELAKSCPCPSHTRDIVSSTPRGWTGEQVETKADRELPVTCKEPPCAGGAQSDTGPGARAAAGHRLDHGKWVSLRVVCAARLRAAVARGREAGGGVSVRGEVTIRFGKRPHDVSRGGHGEVGPRLPSPPPSRGCLFERRHGDANRKPRHIGAFPVAVKLETRSDGSGIGQGGGSFWMGHQGIGEGPPS